jgi:FkbM family methyltransferase
VVKRTINLVQQLLGLLDLFSIVPSMRGRLKLLWLWWALLLRQHRKVSRWLWLCPRELSPKLTWRGPNGPLTAMISDFSQLLVIRQIFVGREYVPPHGLNPKIIVDLGSNAGFSVLFFKSLYPDARIIAVEAHPITFNQLLINTSHLDGVELLNAAVTNYDGQTTLYSGGESWSAALTAAKDRATTDVVPAITLDRIMEKFRLPSIDLLKLDIEGAETEVLPSSQSALRRTRSVIFEYHQEHDAGSLWTLLEQLPGFRLTRFSGESSNHPLVTLTR